MNFSIKDIFGKTQKKFKEDKYSNYRFLLFETKLIFL